MFLRTWVISASVRGKSKIFRKPDLIFFGGKYFFGFSWWFVRRRVRSPVLNGVKIYAPKFRVYRKPGNIFISFFFRITNFFSIDYIKYDFELFSWLDVCLDECWCTQNPVLECRIISNNFLVSLKFPTISDFWNLFFNKFFVNNISHWSFLSFFFRWNFLS